MTEKTKQFSISRTFEAPVSMVFDAFSTADAMAQWWGPTGMNITVMEYDFSVNGRFHYKMQNGDQVMWGLFVYQQIKRPDLIEFIVSFSDEEGNICKAPFDMDFPLQIFNQLILEESGNKTTLTLKGYPLNATTEQEATYYAITESMEQGFNGTFNQLEHYLTQQKNN
ncbi:MAG: SRPBCC domain-containing protein [Bacteroidota bacterium]